jgi:alpha-glucosidase (family GH31 glycosyl hydrolase)
MYEGFKEYTKRRPVIFTPSGWACFQRYAGTWTGDVGGKENTLLQMLNTSMCGHSLCTNDMDNFSKEGIHFGFLLPWSQINSWFSWNHPWLLGENLVEIFKFYVNLRYKLILYIYSLAYEASKTGMPILRPMVLEFMQKNMYNLRHQYMLGKYMLVGAFTDQLTLPKGKWLDYWTGEIIEGGRKMKYVPPENRGGGLFLREGAIIPLIPVMNYLIQKPIKEITFEIFPGEMSSDFVLYEDDGISFRHEQGKFAATIITCIKKSGEVTVNLKARKGKYDGMSAERKYIFKIYQSAADRVTGVSANGKNIAWKTEKNTVVIGPVAETGKDIKITVRNK